MVQPAQTIAQQAASMEQVLSLQYEVQLYLFILLFPCSAVSMDEFVFLERLDALWSDGESLFRSELAGHYDLVCKILSDWHDERQTFAALRHSIAVNEGASLEVLVDRLLAIEKLQGMQLKWKSMKSITGMSPDDWLCKVFMVITNTKETSIFKQGLARLNSNEFEFLRTQYYETLAQMQKTRAV